MAWLQKLKKHRYLSLQCTKTNLRRDAKVLSQKLKLQNLKLQKITKRSTKDKVELGNSVLIWLRKNKLLYYNKSYTK